MKRVYIDLIRYNTYQTVISAFHNINFNDVGRILISVSHKCGSYVDSEVWILISTYFLFLKSLGWYVTINFNDLSNCDTLNYARRINFFELINVNYYENFQRRRSDGRFMELTHLENALYTIPDRLTEIISNNFNLSQDHVEVINFSFGEIIANVKFHAESKIGCVVYAQSFPKRNLLMICIADCGIGIYNSLRKNDKFSNLKAYEALLACVEYEVTSGNGRGHGLYIIRELIKANQGEMKIVSGDHFLEVKKGETIVKDSTFWNGTYITLSFDTTKDLPLKSIYENLGYSTSTQKLW